MKKLIRIFIMLIYVVLLVVIVRSNAYAADTVAQGYCGGEGDGTNLTWKLDSDGVLTISGTGEMADYLDLDTRPWDNFTGSIAIVNVNNGVTSIGSGAFFGCPLTYVTIPDSVISIGSYAFMSCENLSSIVLSDNLNNISDYAFFSCDSFTSITIPDAVTSIGVGAFGECTALSSIQLGKGLKHLDSAFYGCTGLTEIVIDSVSIEDLAYNSTVFRRAGVDGEGVTVIFSDSVLSIPDYLFYKNGDTQDLNIVSVSFGNNVERIGDHSFAEITGIKTITIPDSVTEICSSAFYNCKNLENISLGNGLSVIGSCAFMDCSALSDLEFHGSLESIGDSAFSGCEGLKTVFIPDSVTYIGDSAFYSCTGLSEVVIGNSVASIGGSAFSNCIGITSITIPENVTSIGNAAFSECTSLTTVNYNARNATSSGSVFFKNAGALGDGITAYIGDSVDSIPDNLFKNCKSLLNVSFGNNVSVIGDSSFRGCTGLTALLFPESVTTIGPWAFDGCSRLASITIPENVTNIGSEAFAGCLGLTTINFNAKNSSLHSYYTFRDAGTAAEGIVVTFGDSVEAVPDRIFYGQENIKEVIIGNNVASINYYAFYNCQGLKKVSLGESVSAIGESAFYNCTGLTEIIYNAKSIADFNSNTQAFYNAGAEGEGITVTFGDSVESIPAYLFYSSSQESVPRIKSIKIGENVVSIGARAFYNSIELTEIVYNARNISSFSSDYVFYNAGTSTEGITVLFGETVDRIPSALFYCTNAAHSPKITNAIIGDSVTSIGYSAFNSCTGLERLTIGQSVSSIGDGAFINCTGLVEINYNARNVADLTSSSYIFNNAGTEGKGITITFGDSVESIPAYLFYSSQYYVTAKVKSVTIGENVTSIGKQAFYGCDLISEISYNARSVSGFSSDSNVFYNVGSSVSNLTVSFGDAVETIPSYMLYNSKVKEVSLGDNITSIGSYAFYNCSGLDRIIIGENVSSIGTCAFAGCNNVSVIEYNAQDVSNLTSNTYAFNKVGSNTTLQLTIGSAVEQVPDELLDLESLRSIVVDPNNGYYSSDSGVLYNKPCKVCIKCPLKASGSISLLDSTKIIEEKAFYNCNGITSILIPESVNSIGDKAFYNCTGLSNITYNAVSVSDFTSSSEVFLNVGNTSAGTTVVFGETVETIPAYLFCAGFSTSSINGIKSVSIGSNVTGIGSHAFYGCRNLVILDYYAKRVNGFESESYVFAFVGHNGGAKVIFGPDVESLPSRLFDCSDPYFGFTTSNPKIVSVKFYGDKPAFGGRSFYDISTKGYYPYLNSTWDGISSSVGNGTINWKPYSTGEPVSISLSTLPQKTEYVFGSEINLSGITFSVLFSDGCTESHDYGDVDSVEYDFCQFGERPVTVYYGNASAEFAVSVYEPRDVVADSSLYPESDHPYLNGMDETYSFSYPDARSLTFTFSSDTVVEEQVDFLYVYDGDGNLIATFTNREAAGQTITVDGDSFSIQLVSDESYSQYGFSLDSIVATTTVYSHDHSVEPTYTWAEDDMSVKASKVCPGCGTVLKAEEVQTVMTSEATCADGGQVTYTATFEDPEFETQERSYQVQAGHSWSDVVYTWSEDNSHVTASTDCGRCGEHREETAVVSIVSTVTCTKSGDVDYTAVFEEPLFTSQSRTEHMEALGHDIIEHDAMAPTCTSEGWEAYETCSRCNYTTYESIPALGHDLSVHHNAQNPTCTEPGWYEYDSCSRCDYTTKVEIPALGHNKCVYHEGKQPTCTEPGWYDYYSCIRCGYYTINECAAYGHVWNTPQFSWGWDDEAGVYIVTATRYCSRDFNHSESKIAELSYEEGTGDYEGFIIITASVDFDGETYTNSIHILKRYTVSFDTAGGSPMDPVHVYHGGTINNYLGEPTRPGYRFAGWTLNGEPYELYGTPIYSDITVVAQWESLGLVTITNCKLELAGKISIRLYFRAPENAKTAKIFYEDVKTHGYPETASVTLELTRTGNPNYSASQDLFIMAFPKITSREMTRHIKFVVYDENDQPMWTYYTTGDSYNEAGFEFCAADWANRILGKADSSEEAKFMAKALLNYGGVAQVYLNNFNPDNPANPNNYLADEMAALQPDPAQDIEAPQAAYDIGFSRATLALEADTTIRLYFNNAVKVYVDGVEKKVYSSGGTYLAMIEGISSRNISKKYKITVTSTDGTQSADIYYSVLSWANKQIADGNERSMPTAKALYLYNQAAKAYIK